MPTRLADRETYRVFCSAYEPEEADQVAGIDAVGFVPGVMLAWELDGGFVSVRRGGAPHRKRVPHQRLTDDDTGQGKMLELDVRMAPHGG